MGATTFILVGWLIDGTGGPIQRDVFLEIEKGHISALRPSVHPDPMQHHVTDLSGCTILPGLVDSHVHLFMSGTDDPQIRQRQLQAPYGEVKEVLEDHLREHFLHGVLALRDGGDYGGYALRYKRESLPHGDIPVQIHCPGKAWHAPKRYGSLIGRPPPFGRTLVQAISMVEDHADHIKIVNSGLNSLSVFGRQTPPQFDRETLTKAVEAGLKLGLKTMVHANGKEAVRLAIEAGCYSIEHGFFMGKENLMRLAEKGMTWVPTAFTMEAYSRSLGQGNQEADIARKNLDHQLEQMRLAGEWEVTMAAGTDAGSLGVHHGRALSEEIRLFRFAGLSLEKAIQCATLNGARLLRMEDRMGKLAASMPATFLAFRSSPETLLDVLHRPELIYLGGKQIHGSLISRRPRKNSLYPG